MLVHFHILNTFSKSSAQNHSNLTVIDDGLQSKAGNSSATDHFYITVGFKPQF